MDTDCFAPISHPRLSASAHDRKTSIQPNVNAKDIGNYGRAPSKQMFFSSTSERPIIRIRSVAEGLLLAEEWGFHIASIKPWEKKTKVLPHLPPEFRSPIDKEDAALLSGSPLGAHFGEPTGHAPRKPKIQEESQIFRNVITPNMIDEAEVLQFHLPAAGTEIQVEKEVAQQIAEHIAEASVDDARAGDKVAALAALLGAQIGRSHGKVWRGQAAETKTGDADATMVKLTGM